MPIKSLSSLSLFIAFSLGLLFVSCSSQEQAAVKEKPGIPVLATTPILKDITFYLESIGTLKPSIFMEIRPQASGNLAQVFVDEGQTVRQGDALFKIDQKPYEIKVREAQAQLAMDEAGLKAVQKKMARYKKLVERDLVAQTEWDELKAQLKKAQASLDLGSARLNFAKLELEHCHLDSPIDGRVGKLDAHQGLLVAAGQAAPLATISKMDPLIVEFTVTEKEFPLLSKDIIHIKIESLCAQEGECNEGTVTFLDNQFDEKTGLLLIRGKVSNEDYALRPGQSVRVRVPIILVSNAKLIPQKAIRYNQQGPYAYVVNEDNTVAVRQLVLGKEHGTEQIVLEGLEPNEHVVLEGHLRLSPGIKVEIKS